ncbi:hypothetical protein TTHERM_00028520 (macronuclear) [Tetrahymena thermophila SB210]|uniref:Uncharacterized protein n=1 Tax=Tetrahymena thermophila (strain SB210) TaxID=312017 RepID=Q22N22_TETTS|nr:hypothetical protein TTHERM_00028520 [Tetrahymena thermophila SB210]EAR86268.2 hypothetical protein TTHERM_00028520 [Tetrahymena thermophila SB210]|eukprot:XP_976848.2 hypothetical protein TTHERM_00028520 [Tetrahymena thermophila SB210]
MIANYEEESIEQLKNQIHDLESEVSALRVQLKSKENGWNKEKAILQQQIELQDMQIKESKAREENFRKMNETFMETLQGLTNDSSKFTNKSLKDLKGMFEGISQDNEQSKIKKQDLITKLEAENRELKDQIHEKQLELQKEIHESEKNMLKMTSEIKDLNIQNQNLQGIIKKLEEEKRTIKDIAEQEAQQKINDLQNEFNRIKQENEKEMLNNNALNEERIQQIKELYEKEKQVYESKIIKNKENLSSEQMLTQTYFEELQIAHQTEIQQLQLQIQTLRNQHLFEQQQAQKEKQENELKMQELQEKFKSFKTKSKTNDQNIKLMKEKLEKSKQDTEQINQLNEQNKKLKQKNKQLTEQIKKLEQVEIKLKDQLIEKNHIIEEEKLGNVRKENIIKNMQENTTSVAHHEQSNFVTDHDLSISQFQLRQQNNNLFSASVLNNNTNPIHSSVQNMDGLGLGNPNHQISQGGLSSHQQSYNQHLKSVSECDFQQIIQSNQQIAQNNSEIFIQQDSNPKINTDEIPKRAAPNRAQQRLQGGNNPLAGQIIQRGQSKNMNSPEAKQQHLLQMQQLQQQQFQPLIYKQNSNNNLFQQNIPVNQNNNLNNGIYKSISSSNSNLGLVNNQTNRTNLSGGGLMLTTNQDVMMYTQNTQNNYTDEDIVNIQNQANEKPQQGIIANSALVHSSSANSMNNQNIYSNNIFYNPNNPTNSQISMPQSVQSRNLCEGCRVGVKHLFSQQRQNLSVPSRHVNSSNAQLQQVSQHHQSLEDDHNQFEIQDLQLQVEDLSRQLGEKNYENEQLKQQINTLEQEILRISDSHSQAIEQNQNQCKEIDRLNELLSQTSAEKKKKEENEVALKQEIKYLVDKLLKAKEKIDLQQQPQQDTKNSDQLSQNLYTEFSNNNQFQIQNNNKNMYNQSNNNLNNSNLANSPKIKVNISNNFDKNSQIFNETNSNARSNTLTNKLGTDLNLQNKFNSIYSSNYNSVLNNQQNSNDATTCNHNQNKVQNPNLIKNSQLTTSVNISQMLNQSSCVNQSLCLNCSTKSPGFLNFIHQNKENSSFQTRKNGYGEEKILFGALEKSPTSNYNLGKSTDLLQQDFQKYKGIINTSQNLNNQNTSQASNNLTSNNNLEQYDSNIKAYSNLGTGLYQNITNSYRQTSQCSQYSSNNLSQNQGNSNICRSDRKGQNNLKSMIQKEEERGFYFRSKTPFTSRFNQSLEKSNHIPMQDTSTNFEQTKKQLFSQENNINQIKNPLKALQQQQLRRNEIPKSKPSYLFD